MRPEEAGPDGGLAAAGDGVGPGLATAGGGAGPDSGLTAAGDGVEPDGAVASSGVKQRSFTFVSTEEIWRALTELAVQTGTLLVASWKIPGSRSLADSDTPSSVALPHRAIQS